MFELRALVEGLNRTFGGERARVAELVDAELVCIQSVTIAGLSESEGTVTEEICNVPDGFPVEASSDVPGL